jgi:hypothetical protein
MVPVKVPRNFREKIILALFRILMDYCKNNFGCRVNWETGK